MPNPRPQLWINPFYIVTPLIAIMLFIPLLLTQNRISSHSIKWWRTTNIAIVFLTGLVVWSVAVAYLAGSDRLTVSECARYMSVELVYQDCLHRFRNCRFFCFPWFLRLALIVIHVCPLGLIIASLLERRSGNMRGPILQSFLIVALGVIAGLALLSIQMPVAATVFISVALPFSLLSFLQRRAGSSLKQALTLGVTHTLTLATFGVYCVILAIPVFFFGEASP